MPASLALILSIALVIVLLARDARGAETKSLALWLPVLWMSVTSSRFITQWHAALRSESTSVLPSDGSPVDAAYFSTLILLGLIVLARRGIAISEWASRNRWLVAFFAYATISIAWSDFPAISIKRWIKALGHPVMALIILTDPDPSRAFRLIMKRVGYLLITFSVMLVKYVPEIGRGYDRWTGRAYYHGVAQDKNGLGLLCLMFGIFFLWEFLVARGNTGRPVARRSDVWLSAAVLGVIVWLLDISDSATSLVCALVGGSFLIALQARALNIRHVGTYLVLCLMVVALAEMVFGASAQILTWLGRDPDLTDRTLVWGDALALVESRAFGAGYESFWLGHRLEALWEKWWWQPNQAHNGYIEMYLNLGLVGVAIFVGLVLSTFFKIKESYRTDPAFAAFRLALLLTILLYNFTEATFKAVSLAWTLFYVISIDCPVRDERSIGDGKGLALNDSHRPRHSLKERSSNRRLRPFGTKYRDEKR